MAAHYPRTPGSLAAVVRECMDLVGVEVLADAVGKGPELIYAWSRESKTEPSWEQIRLLEAVCLRRKGRAPFSEDLYRRADGLAGEVAPHQPAPVSKRTVSLIGSASDMLKRFEEAMADGRITLNEHVDVEKALKALEQEIQNIRRDMKAAENVIDHPSRMAGE